MSKTSPIKTDGARPAGPVVLIIRDGWGENPHPEHDAFNAVKLAKTPVADRLMRDWPHALIKTCGEDVGLPPGPPPTMGNSEVGHQNIGAGRIVDQELMRITRAIRDGSFFAKKAFLDAMSHSSRTGACVHLLGLVSNGQVHSDMDHLFALIEFAAKFGVPKDQLFIHVITDGRDTGPKTGVRFIEQVEAKLRSAGVGRIASVIGRFYAMDRDHRWDRVAWAYQALTGQPVSHPNLIKLLPGVSRSVMRVSTAVSAGAAVSSYYANPTDAARTGDEFIVPTQIIDMNYRQPIGLIEEGDAVIFFNFRGDRPRELTKAFMLDDEQWRKVPNALQNVGGFDRGVPLRDLFFCTMTGYESGLPVSAIAFEKPPKMPDILGEVVSKAGLAQFRCAETEKFPHVTFFFNDYREHPFPGEQRELIPSPKDVTTYDQKPQMSAHGVCDAVLMRLAANDCEPLIIVNFANPDMVGHTGNLQAAIMAVEVVDECVGRIVEATLKRGGSLIITADHGNAEQMWNPETNSPHTAHTIYDVPLIVVGERLRGRSLRSGGRLADIAPTVLELMGQPQPKAMTGQSLV